MTSDPTGGRVLRDPAFRHLWAGMTVSKLGSSIAAVATPLIAVQLLDASAFMVSLLTAAAWLPWLIIGLPAGAWLDRTARRPVMIAADLASAAVVVTVPIAAALGVLTMAHLLAVALALGAAAVFFTVGWTAYLPAMFDKGRLVEANSIIQGTESAAQVAGPAIGGILVSTVSAVSGLVADAASFLLSALFLWRIRRPERHPTRPSPQAPVPARPDGPASAHADDPASAHADSPASSRPNDPASARPDDPASAAHRSSRSAAPAAGGAAQGIRAEIATGVRWLARDRHLRNLTVHGATSNLMLTGLNALTIVFLVRDVGIGTTGVGLLLAVSSVGGVSAAAAAPALARRFGAARTLVACKVTAGLASVLVPLTSPGPGLAAFVAGMVGVGFGVVAGNVLAGTFRQTYCPPELLGRVVTGMQFVNLGAIPLGAVLAGALASVAGVRSAITIMTIGYALSGAILLLGPLRGRRALPSTPDTAPTPAPAPDPV